MNAAAHHEMELLIQYQLCDVLDKIEKTGQFSPDELALVAYQFGIRYEPKLDKD